MATHPAAPGQRHVPGFSAPAVGFDEPFAMLEACHERVQRSLALLQRLREHLRALPGQAADDAARQAARDVLRYFDIAAPLHHQDEELHVFPRLLHPAAPQPLRALVLRLQQDHRLMEADWAAARVPLLALAQGGAQGFTPADDEVLDRFAARYGEHILAEEGTAYPAAAAQVEGDALAAMGREMARRRGAP